MTLLSATASSADRPVPLPSGMYDFRFRDAEFPNWTGIPVSVTIKGDYITVVNETSRGDIPGMIWEVTLMWNDRAGKWVPGEKESDRNFDVRRTSRRNVQSRQRRQHSCVAQ